MSTQRFSVRAIYHWASGWPAWLTRSGVRNLFAIAGHFVSCRWVSGPHNCLVILRNLLKTKKKLVHQQKQTTRLLASPECFAGRTKFFCGPHVGHLCTRLNITEHVRVSHKGTSKNEQARRYFYLSLLWRRRFLIKRKAWCITEKAWFQLWYGGSLYPFLTVSTKWTRDRIGMWNLATRPRSSYIQMHACIEELFGCERRLLPLTICRATILSLFLRYVLICDLRPYFSYFL